MSDPVKPTPKQVSKARLPDPIPEFEKETALARIAELEEENESLKTRISELEGNPIPPTPILEPEPKPEPKKEKDFFSWGN